VLPNKISSFLIDEKLYQPIRYSPLEAAAIARLSIRVLEAEDVEQKQTFDKLNPYIILTCKGGTAGDLKRRTKAVDATKKNACVWNEHFDFLITDDSKEIVELQLMDKGVVTDDPCGCLRLPVEYLARAAKGGIGWSEKWHPLTQAKSGRIKLAIEYAELVPDDGPTEMDKPASKATPETPKEAEHGVVVLRIVEAQNVPTSMFGKPSAYVTIDYENKLGAQRQRTRTIQSTCNPHFDEDFSFQVENTKETEEEFVLKLKDHTGLNVAIVGEATLKLKEVLEYRSPRNYQLKLGNASLVVQAHFETAKVEHLAVGSDWLNGILR
jgi:Ca2+-dependent lipid-binding protein